MLHMALKRSAERAEAKINGTGESYSKKKRIIRSFHHDYVIPLMAGDNLNRQSYQMEQNKLENVRVDLEERLENRSES